MVLQMTEKFDPYLGSTSTARTREAVDGTDEVDKRVDLLGDRVRTSATNDLLVGVGSLVVSKSPISTTKIKCR